MKRQEERRRRWEEEEDDELLRPKQEQAQPPPQLLLMPRASSGERHQWRSGASSGERRREEEEEEVKSVLEARDEEWRGRSASMEEDGHRGKREKRREAKEKKGEEEVDEERMRRAVSVDERRHSSDRRRREEVRMRGVSVDETPPGRKNYARETGGQRLRGLSLDERTEGEGEEEEEMKGRRTRVPVTIGVDQQMLVPAPEGDIRVPVTIGVDQRSLVSASEVKNHSEKQQEMERGREAAGRKELMKSLDDEDKERLLLERREEIDGNQEVRKTSHGRTTERRRDSTGERRKSGHRADSEEKRRRDSSEGKKISRTSRSQSSERILESGKSQHRKSSESRSASSDRILKQLERLGPSVGREPVQGIYVGEYQNQSWVFVGEITSVPREVASHERRPLQRSASQESTASEKDFSKAYQAITHRMVHRKSSAIMYSRILERTFECNKTVLVHRFVPFFSNTDSTIESLGWGLDSEFISHFFLLCCFTKRVPIPGLGVSSDSGSTALDLLSSRQSSREPPPCLRDSG